VNFRAAFAVALLAALPATLPAQAAPRRAGGFSLAAGVGAGSTSFSCDACVSQRDDGVGAVLRLGVNASSHLTLAAEASGWRADYDALRGTGKARVGLAQLVLQWYPSASAGAFVKAGGGVAAIRDELTLNDVGSVTVSTRNPAFVVGAGWEVGLGRHWAVVPFADLNVVSKGDQTVNDAETGERLGATLLHAGVAIRVR